MSFQPGDMVVVLNMKGVHYPRGCQPGVIATIRAKCQSCRHACNDTDPANRWRIKTDALPNACAPAIVLRKIEGEPRQVVDWDSVPWQPAREAVTT